MSDVTDGPATTPRDQLQAVLKLGRRMLRVWWVPLAVALVGGVATLAWYQTRPKVWRSDTVLLYREGIRWSQSEGNVESTLRVGQRLKEMVLARSRLEKLVTEMKLYPDVGGGEAVQEMRRHVQFRVGEGDTVIVSFEGDSPEQAQKVTARLAEMLVGENRRFRTEQAEIAQRFLDQEKERNEIDLRQKEAALAQFLARHPEFAQDQMFGAGGASGAAVRASREDRGRPTGDLALSALERERARLRRRLENPDAPVPAAPRAPDPALNAAKLEAQQRLASARRELAEKQAVFTEQHPDVRAAAARLKLAETNYKRAVDALSAWEDQNPSESPLPVDKKGLETRLSQVERELAARKAAARGEAPAPVSASGVADRIVEIETEFARLNREVGESRDRYQQLEGKQFIAQMAATSVTSGQAAQMTVVDPAFLPQKPLGPGRSKIVVLGAAAALLLGLLLAFVMALIDDRILDEEDAEDAAGTLLVSVPRLPARRAG